MTPEQVPPIKLLALARAHVAHFRRLIEWGKRGERSVRVDECEEYLRIWSVLESRLNDAIAERPNQTVEPMTLESVGFKYGARERGEVHDAILCGEFDTLLGIDSTLENTSADDDAEPSNKGEDLIAQIRATVAILELEDRPVLKSVTFHPEDYEEFAKAVDAKIPDVPAYEVPSTNAAIMMNGVQIYVDAKGIVPKGSPVYDPPEAALFKRPNDGT